jgi:hypothetical protein
MYQVAAHIMDKRNDAMNMMEINVPLEPMQTYLRKKRAEGKEYSHLGLVLAAYVRAVAEYPVINRFVVNKTIYARNEIAVGMVVLKPGESEGTMNKMFFKPTDTVDDVHRTLAKYVEENRAAGDTNSTDDLIRKLLKVPGLCRFGVCVFKVLDKFGLLPKKIIDASPFHCSMTITNLASIRTNYIYHHVYNYGTTSMLAAMGVPIEVPVRKKGEIEFEKCIPVGFVMDERICSGHYYAVAFQRFRQYMADPRLLEGPPKVVNPDPEI